MNSKINICKAEDSDMKRIFEIEKRSYTPQLQATHEVLKERFDSFGIWIAEYEGELRGFFTCVPVSLDFPVNTERIIQNRKPHYKPWFQEYEKGINPNTLFVTSTAVESKFQKKGIGSALVKYSLSLAQKLELKYRASALRCEYAKFYNKTTKSIEDYIQEVENGTLKDRFLGLYLRLGFNLKQPLPDYEPYKGSKNYNIFAFKEV